MVTMASQLPWVAFPLIVGVFIDRVRKSSLLGVALAVQTLACLALALAVHAGLLWLPMLMMVAFVLVVGQVIAEGTRSALVPSVIGRDGLDAANSRLLVIDVGIVRFLIPPLAGFLVVWNQAAVGWVAAFASCAALVLSTQLRAREELVVAAGTKRMRPLLEVKEGLHYLVGNKLLRSITVAVSVGSFAWFMGYATFALYIGTVLHLDARGYGLLLACMAVGFASAAVVASRIISRLGYSSAMRMAVAIEVVCKLSLGVLPVHWAVVGVVLYVHSFATFVWNVSSQSSRQRFTPPELLGRVLTSHRALSWGVAPLGAAIGGVVANAWGLSVVWIVAAAIQATGVALVWGTVSPRGFADARAMMTSARDCRSALPQP